MISLTLAKTASPKTNWRSHPGMWPELLEPVENHGWILTNLAGPQVVAIDIHWSSIRFCSSETLVGISKLPNSQTQPTSIHTSINVIYMYLQLHYHNPWRPWGWFQALALLWGYAFGRWWRAETLQKTSGKILTKNFGPVIESASEYLNSEAFEISWDLCHEFPYTMFLPFCWSMFPLLSTAPVPKWLTIGRPNLRKATLQGPTSALSMTWVVLMQKSMGSFLRGWKIEYKRVQLSAVFFETHPKMTQPYTTINWI